MDQKFLKENNERVKYYTGLPYFQVLIGLLTSIWPHMSHPSRLLSPFQMLNARISPMVGWPRRDALNVTVPFQFVEVCGKRVAVILDCFEISTQRPFQSGGRRAAVV